MLRPEKNSTPTGPNSIISENFFQEILKNADVDAMHFFLSHYVWKNSELKRCLLVAKIQTFYPEPDAAPYFWKEVFWPVGGGSVYPSSFVNGPRVIAGS